MKKILALAPVVGVLATGCTMPGYSVTVDPGDGEGSAITAYVKKGDALDATYTMYEDCSIAEERNGEYVERDWTYIIDMPEELPVRAPLANTARDFMPWCALN